MNAFPSSPEEGVGGGRWGGRGEAGCRGVSGRREGGGGGVAVGST